MGEKSVSKEPLLRLGLRAKMFLVILTIVFVMAACGLLIARYFVKDLVYSYFAGIGSTAIDVVSTQLDPDKIPEYFEIHESGAAMPDDYVKVQELVTEVAEKEEDIEYLYVIEPREDAVYYVFDSSVAMKDVFSSIDYGDPTVPSKEEMLSGEQITKDMTTGAYGHLYTVWSPIFDSNGKPVAYFGADISADMLARVTRVLTIIMLAIFAAVAVIVSVIFIILTERRVVRPIVKLNKAAHDLTESMDSSGLEDLEEVTASDQSFFDKLTINSADEIGDLHQSLIRMEQASHDYQVGMLKATSEKERLSTELNIAADIQAGMLPAIAPRFDDHEEYELAALMRPAKEVGGDFYDFFYTDPDHLALVIADVSGKGVPAALFMMMSMILIKQQAQRGGTPAEILEQVNNMLCENNPNDMFVTVWLGIVDLNTGHTIATNGGHEYPILANSDGAYSTFEDEHGLFLGGVPGVKYKDYEIDIPVGGSVFVYTDGVPEARNVDDQFFEIQGIVKKLNDINAAVPADSIKELTNAVDSFAGECDQFDDITMVCFKYKGRKTKAE